MLPSQFGWFCVASGISRILIATRAIAPRVLRRLRQSLTDKLPSRDKFCDQVLQVPFSTPVLPGRILRGVGARRDAVPTRTRASHRSYDSNLPSLLQLRISHCLFPHPSHTHPPLVAMGSSTHPLSTTTTDSIKHVAGNGGNADANRAPLGNTADSLTELAKQNVAPFLAKYHPRQYAPRRSEDGTTTVPRTTSGGYCYRHQPDSKCSRQADEQSMHQLQTVRPP